MAAINDLIRQISDPQLRDRIQKEVDKLAKQKKFGLVFEEHLPEGTRLYDMRIKKGSNVVLKKDDSNVDIYKVLDIKDGIALCTKKSDLTEVKNFNVSELVCFAEFGEPIYPYLKPIDSVCNAPNKELWHTLIEADNYHALQLLEYLYAGKVDCIYIDPPYNKEDSRDWSYNCDYVDGNDSYRHSKWLSMMKKRLLIAKKILNPECSFLIVTIDEEEYLHLGCLLEEIFPEASVQMVCSKIKSGTSMRMYEFSRCNEYIYYVRIGSAVIEKEIPDSTSTEIPWRPLMRSGTGSNNFREARPNSFYPIFVSIDGSKKNYVGRPLLDQNIHPDDIAVPEGFAALWPIDSEGRERVWGASVETINDYLENGYARITRRKNGFGIQYITTGVIQDINNGNLIVTGKDETGGIVGNYITGKAQMPQNQWDIPTHNATTYGTNLIKSMIGDRFTFPKSLYAVRDCIKHAIGKKKDALVVDFFAGSGTTLHAINLLNAEDGGERRCILVTNNEVSENKQNELLKHGYKPGDEKWQSLGIARYVTWPRTVCSIKGCDINGKALKGDYVSNVPLPIHMENGFETNAIYFKLGFLDKTEVSLGLKFKEMFPTLWMKSGAKGEFPDFEVEGNEKMLVLPKNRFAVLLDENYFSEFANQIANEPLINTVYLVTDYEANYRSMANILNVENTYQLYRDYLDNFRINHRGN